MESSESYHTPGIIARTVDKGLEHLLGALLVAGTLTIAPVAWVLDCFHKPYGGFNYSPSEKVAGEVSKS